MATRAGVSESVFFEVFPSIEECHRAAFDEGLDRLSRTVTEATARQQAWLERVRSGLVALLGFFDDEPSWARLLLLDTPRDRALTFECTQRLHGALAALLERTSDAGDRDDARDRDSGGDRDGAGDPEGAGRTAGSPTLLATLTGELVVGGVYSVIRTNMLEADGGKLVELAPSLMAFIVAPYLGQAAAQAELEGRPCAATGTPESQPTVAGDGTAGESGPARARAIARAGELPIRATHRTTLVLRAIAQAPYSNNREIAQAAGLADEGQASKLLARLEQRGVIENVGVGAERGEPNAWLLTQEGRRVVELLAESFAERAPRRASGRIRGAR